MISRNLALVLACATLLLAACNLPTSKANPVVQPTVVRPTVVARVATPVPTPTTPVPTATPKPLPAIVVTAPMAGQLVRSPVRVTGSAQVFEGTVSFAIKDASGKVIGKGFTTATAGAPERGTFSADITFTQPITSQQGTVEVFTNSAKDGSVKDLVAIQVTLSGR